MTDKDLLELAAIAYGYKMEVLEGRPSIKYNDSSCTPKWSPWNPLTDDGDALKLAVKLQLTVHQWPEESCACNYKGTVNESEPLCDDRYAATRLAIVRAAANCAKSIRALKEQS